MSLSEEEATADRATAMLEGMADAWAVEHNIMAAIEAACSVAGPHTKKLAAVMYGVVTQAWIEAAYTGFNAHKDLVDATPAPALAPQDGGLRAAAQAVLRTAPYSSDYAFGRARDALREVLASPPEPDLLPGLRRARDMCAENGPVWEDELDAEIARREGGSK